MLGFAAVRVILCAVAPFIGATASHAALKFEVERTDRGTAYIFVSGDFDYRDDLSAFETLVRTTNARAVTFHSPGGNIAKAMELGRIIRRLGLITMQPRAIECSSACSLAFFGGTLREAQPGAIGVHKSSFSGDVPINTQDAVAGIQQMTAEIVAYMVEMGVDPSLLQVSLQYDSSDIRYLSLSEMLHYRIVTSGAQGAQQPQVAQPGDVSRLRSRPLCRSLPNSHSRHRAAMRTSRSHKSAQVASVVLKVRLR